MVEAAYLGDFSFTQFVMWNDIRNRVDDLARNKLVRSLIDGKLSWPATAMQPGGRVDEAGTLLPLSADASQLYAIQQAASGRSFVLHGPPGTGKSQTITALIPNALAQGKTVLFVAEKMAALSVVQSRLERIGIRPFCLELHSNKSRKRDVLEQLHAATEVVRGRPRPPGRRRRHRRRHCARNWTPTPLPCTARAPAGRRYPPSPAFTGRSGRRPPLRRCPPKPSPRSAARGSCSGNSSPGISWPRRARWGTPPGTHCA